MKTFAKLFERDGVQVLVTRQENDEYVPELRFRFAIGEDTAELSMAFKDHETGEAKRDKAFEEMSESEAFKIRDRTVGDAMVQGLLA